MLCYGCTVHKSQGLTLDTVEVHAQDMFHPSLLPVAISRVRTSQGLRITGFRKSNIIKPDQELLKAIASHGLGEVPDDISCCRRRDDTIGENDFDIIISDDEEEDNLFWETSCNIPQASANTNRTPVVHVLSQQRHKSPVTFTQQGINNDIDELMQMDLNEIYQEFLEKITSLYVLHVAGQIKSDDANGKVFSGLISDVHKYLTEYVSPILTARKVPNKYHKYLRAMFLQMMQDWLTSEREKQAKDTIDNMLAAPIQPGSSAGDGAIRRVAGITLYKLSRNYTKLVQQYQGTADLGNSSYLRIKHLNAIILDCRCSITDVQNGKYPHTARQTSKKSSRCGENTQVTDEFLEFFIELDKKRQLIQTISNGLLIGSTILRHSYLSLMMDSSLRDMLYNCLSSRLAEFTECVDEFYSDIVRRFLLVGNNAYRKGILTHLNDKSLAHRKKIEASSETSGVKRRKKNAKVCALKLEKLKYLFVNLSPMKGRIPLIINFSYYLLFYRITTDNGKRSI